MHCVVEASASTTRYKINREETTEFICASVGVEHSAVTFLQRHVRHRGREAWSQATTPPTGAATLN